MDALKALNIIQEENEATTKRKLESKQTTSNYSSKFEEVDDNEKLKKSSKSDSYTMPTEEAPMGTKEVVTVLQ